MQMFFNEESTDSLDILANISLKCSVKESTIAQVTLQKSRRHWGIWNTLFDLFLWVLYIQFKQVISLGGKMRRKKDEEERGKEKEWWGEAGGDAKKRMLLVSLEALSASLARGSSLDKASWVNQRIVIALSVAIEWAMTILGFPDVHALT